MSKTRYFPQLMVIIMAFPLITSAQKYKAFDRGSFALKGDTLPYRILFPLDFDPAKKYPMVLVLHGSGERGSNNTDQLKYGAKLFLNDTIRDKYPSIVIFPQCPAEDYWSNVDIETDSATEKRKFIFRTDDSRPTKAMVLLLSLVDEFLDKPYIDKHRVYIGGLSMGGMGTFEIIGRRPNIFAAAFAICGGDNTLNAQKYAKKVPLWVFHGERDNIVPYTHSESMVEAIKEAGGDPKYTLYMNDGHNCWDDAFKEPDLIPWLFSHSK